MGSVLCFVARVVARDTLDVLVVKSRDIYVDDCVLQSLNLLDAERVCLSASGFSDGNCLTCIFPLQPDARLPMLSFRQTQVGFK